MTRSAPAVEPLDASHVGAASALLARAFADNPGYGAVLWRLDRATRVRVIERMKRALLRATLRGGLVEGAFFEGTLAGVSLVLPPGGYPTGLRSLLEVALATIQPATLSSIPDALRASTWMEKKHLRMPHYYLWVLGVEPRLQGRGMGGALLRSLDARADEAGVPAWLETDREENVTLYRRHGFEVVDDAMLPTSRPCRFWTMRREPSARRADQRD